MDKDFLLPWQAAQVGRSIGPAFVYLGRLKARLDALGFPPDDALYRAVKTAWDGMYGLTVELHYLACKSGVGRSAKE